ncbi:hypothetical protein C8J56DRAFT_1047577 [Mycena floridula]|nr:hypothetical protein C8J56DRAFT_1047577 [Mycena floridula]
MSNMDIVEPAEPRSAPSKTVHSSDSIQYWKDKCIDLLEKREALQTRVDDACFDYCSLKEKYRDCCRDLNSAEGEVKDLKGEINSLNEKINTLSNRLESRGRSTSPKRRRKESAMFDDSPSPITLSTNEVQAPQIVKGVPKHSLSNVTDPKKDITSFLGDRPLPTTVADVMREMANAQTNSFTGKCGTVILSCLRTEAMHTPLHVQTPAMKTLIESGWKEPAGFSSSFKRAKKQKPTVDVLPVMRFQSPGTTASDSYLPLMQNIPSSFDPTKTSATLTDAEIKSRLAHCPSTCPKYLTRRLNDKQAAEYLLYRADSKHQYPGVDIMVDGDSYSINLRQVRGALSLLHLLPSCTETNGRFRHKLTAEFTQLVAVPGKYTQLLHELNLTVRPADPVEFAEFPTPPDGVAITKMSLTKHLQLCNVTPSFMDDIFPYGRRFTELQVGRSQPVEESGSVNQVRESDWSDTLTESNNAITFGRPSGRPGDNVLFNTVLCVPVALRPSHQKSKPAVVHAAPKTPNPQVDQTAKQLGVISFSGLPPFVDSASESTSPAPMTIVMPEPLTETGGDSNSDDADMVPLEDIIDTETLCTGEEEEEASFADAPEGDADDVMMAVVTT